MLHIFVVIVAMHTMGCIGISNIRYSRPTLEDNMVITLKFEKGVGEMFVTQDIAFHVYPLNAKDSGVALLPIPFPYKESPTSEPAFDIGISLKPSRSGISFNPQRVLYWRDPAEKFSPVSIIGPYECVSSVARPPIRTLPVDIIDLEKNIASCFWLTLNVVPPDPSQVFFIHVNGLVLEGKDYLLPVIRFKEDKRKETFAIP